MNVKRKNNNTYQIIPQNNSKCVWMEAGIVSYKICDRNFECESCPLDIGLRGEKDIHQKFSDFEKQQTEEFDLSQQQRESMLDCSCEGLLKFKWDEHCFVHPGHSWIKILNKSQVKIGIDDIVATALGCIDEVILPIPSEIIKRGASCGQVIQFEHIFSIVSPVSGQVVEINKELTKFPNRLTLDPLNKGWMIIIKPYNLKQDIKFCRSGDALMSWYLKELKWFEGILAKGFNQQRENIGNILTKSGEISRNLRNYLPKDHYRQLIISLLGVPESNRGESEEF
jgi:glycine cleavage system H protein